MSAKKARMHSEPETDVSIEALVDTLLQPVVAFHPIFAQITESITAGLMLSQAWYWKDKGTKDPNGWFHKSQKEWQKETRLTRYEQEGAREILQDKGFMRERRSGQPARLWFRVETRNVINAIKEVAKSENSQIAENQQSSMRQTNKQDGSKPAIKIVENQQSIKGNSENTTKNTTEREQDAQRAPDELHPLFCTFYKESYSLPYTAASKDQAQLKKLRERLGGLLALEAILRALTNYFATPQASHTLADFCTRYAIFQKHALDRFNKPVERATANQPTESTEMEEGERERKSHFAVSGPGTISLG